MANKKTDKKIIGNEHTRFTGTMGIENKQPPISVKLPPEIDAIVRQLLNRSEFFRRAIINQLYRIGLLPPKLAEKYCDFLDRDLLPNWIADRIRQTDRTDWLQRLAVREMHRESLFSAEEVSQLQRDGFLD